MTENFLVDAFQASVEVIGPESLDLLYELAVGVHWPHRRRDLALFLELGHGYMVRDEIGRIMGSAMSFPVADDFATLGMMITAPRLQAQGTGGRLLEMILRDCEGRDIRLNTTRSGYRLYESVGFKPQNTILQHQGTVREIHAPDAVPGVTVRPFALDDMAAVLALDLIAYGADRSRTLDRLFVEGEALMVAERGGAVCGYAARRPFGRRQVIGPIVAEDEAMAMQLTAPLLQGEKGQFIRVDITVGEGDFSAFLAAAGLGVYDNVYEMSRGRERRPRTGLQLFALATQAFG